MTLVDRSQNCAERTHVRGPESNTIMARIAGKSPISVQQGSITVGDRKIEGPGWAVRIIYPNPLNRRRFVSVNAGTDVEGMRLTEALGTPLGRRLAGLHHNQSGGEDEGMGGGVTAVGFFDQTWWLDRGLDVW
jgi:hypothetical protein